MSGDSLLLGLYRRLPEPLRQLVPDRLRAALSYALVYAREYDSAYDAAIEEVYDRDLLPSPTIRVLDVGARYGPQSRLSVLDAVGGLRLTGVEPDEAEASRLDERHPEKRFVASALSDASGTRELYLTSHRDWSSLYVPNETLLERFDCYDEHYRVEDTVEVDTTTLDALSDELEEQYDLITIDTQGSEVDIMAAGTRTLAEAVAVEFESHFKPLYEGQPLFYEAHELLSELEFEIVDVCSGARYRRWTRDGVTVSPNPDGEIVEHDPLYFDFDLPDREAVFKLLVVSLLYRKKSVAIRILRENRDRLTDAESERLERILDGIPSPS